MTNEFEDLDPTLSFVDYLDRSMHFVAEGGPSPTGSELFVLARALKGHPFAREYGVASVLRHVIRYAAKRHGGPIDWVDFEDDDVEVQFHAAWERARFPMGADPVEIACSLAGEGALGTGVKRPGRYSQFLTIAACLQLMVGSRPIYLPGEKLATAMGCKQRTVSSWIAWSIDDAVVVKTKEHMFEARAQARAAEYVFGLHRWQKETIKALASRIAVRLQVGLLAWTAEQFEDA